jgi:hypothetical protein
MHYRCLSAESKSSSCGLSLDATASEGYRVSREVGLFGVDLTENARPFLLRAAGRSAHLESVDRRLHVLWSVPVADSPRPKPPFQSSISQLAREFRLEREAVDNSQKSGLAAASFSDVHGWRR